MTAQLALPGFGPEPDPPPANEGYFATVLRRCGPGTGRLQAADVMWCQPPTDEMGWLEQRADGRWCAAWFKGLHNPAQVDLPGTFETWRAALVERLKERTPA